LIRIETRQTDSHGCVLDLSVIYCFICSTMKHTHSVRSMKHYSVLVLSLLKTD